MICKNCGAEIKDGFLFCPSCGTKAGESGSSTGFVEEKVINDVETAGCEPQINDVAVDLDDEKTISIFSRPVEAVVDEDDEKTIGMFSEPVEELPTQVDEDDEKTIGMFGMNAPDVAPQPEVEYVAPQPEAQTQPEISIGEQLQNENGAKPKKKVKKIITIAVASVLLIALLATLLCASFSPIQVISSQNSPVQDVVDAYVKTNEDGYVAEYTRTYYINGNISSSEKTKYTYGEFDFDNGTREFATISRTELSGEKYYSYVTPDYNFYNYEGDFGNLSRNRNYRDRSINYLFALSAKNYKELANYLNCIVGYPVLDEAGFNSAMRSVNREFKDEDYFNEIFGFEKEKDGKTTTYTFEYDQLKVAKWFRDICEENAKAFRNESAQQLILLSFDQEIKRRESSNRKVVCRLEVEIEDGYVVSERKETETIRDNETVNKEIIEIKYSDHGDASPDDEVVRSFNSYKSQLGSNERMHWSGSGKPSIYDKDGNRVN